MESLDASADAGLSELAGYRGGDFTPGVRGGIIGARHWRLAGHVVHGDVAALIVTKKGNPMAAMKPRTGDGPLEVTKEGRGIVLRMPLEGGGRLVVEMTPDEVRALGAAIDNCEGLA